MTSFATGLHTYSGLPSLRVSHPWCSVPLPSPASTITLASDISAMSRFRMTKFLLAMGLPIGNWDTARWFFIISIWRRWFDAGYVLSNGVPRTATVLPPAAMAVWCDTSSIPAASPLTTVTPLPVSIFDTAGPLLFLPCGPPGAYYRHPGSWEWELHWPLHVDLFGGIFLLGVIKQSSH